ncbi:serine/arginine repetitive matrix protein 1-like isoform X8 [Panicum virgatum]|uniref:serine/arginine repetitive matrix protein 1-like isoform X8 n=1 Tax=Panicum virgatum TaxID=38727 RepID=UPI0019D68496|nr:serine/arginine repetitive matrix protein 1-like isoform X8 [Panicum virgatum]
MAAGSVTRPHTHSRRHRLVCLHAAAITARFRGSQCLHAASRRRSPSSHASSRTQIATPSPPTANRAAFPRDAASHRYPRGLPSPRRLSSPSPSPATSLRLRLARRPRRADALHAAVAHEARSSPCAADSSVPSSAAGAPLLSSRLLPPSTLAERKAVPLASPHETPRPDASETAAPPSSSTARLDQDAAMQGGKWLWTKRRMADHPILSLTTGSIRPQVFCPRQDFTTASDRT